ncbi:hypothetical protein [Pseudomonas oryzihabitans]|uniref:Uncharacterized protein n=1 Tax=Pseudomonas oryzihabitans TaxID=47885 RepID=A0A1G5MBD4_9PSED|nr:MULTISPECIES: hypothetical protein [Pseudomonas]MBH3332026.1 hypothetical protein [Pseudomonas oryzihabitans]NMY88538.1 hypothetical protein [Pseudomonas psychrotolerans]SCZ21798.1 hypothetical protein SAMN05216279_101429 [Pseudomonas psychrotolerans]
MNGPNPCCDLGMSTSLLEQELAERKTRLAHAHAHAHAQADAQRQFLSYADEHACIAVLERALAKAYRFF